MKDILHFSSSNLLSSVAAMQSAIKAMSKTNNDILCSVSIIVVKIEF